jgi:pantoate--beta-alanine ligase
LNVIKDPRELRKTISDFKKNGKTIAFVPTMGYLHAGHISLMQKAKEKCDILVVSIFVNPAQFNDPQDLINYPIDTEGDLAKCQSEDVDIVFLPTKEDIYPDGIPAIKIEIPSLMNVLCGSARPGHFEGILIVLSRLFHFVQPDIAVFGKKDYQQYKVVDRFVKDLAFSIEIIGSDTLRETDGLAMSSRNARLSEKEREAAILIPRTINLAKKLLDEGERDIKNFKEILQDVLASSSLLRVDYLELVDPESLQPLEKIETTMLLALAVFSGNVRLIDNTLLEI